MRVTLLDDKCDRCGKQADELYPWKPTQDIMYKGKNIRYPWLCKRCLFNHKELAWRRGYA